MLRLTVNKSHSVTRYEVASTERQTEDVLVEPFIAAALWRQPIVALCFSCLRCCPIPNEVFDVSERRQIASQPSLPQLA